MSFNTTLSGPEAVAVRMTSSAWTTIVDATDEAKHVSWVSFGEHAGTGVNLTVSLYDGTNDHYLCADGYCWNVRALDAKQAISFDDVVVPFGWLLRSQSSNSSGLVHATGKMGLASPVGAAQQ